jgi:hypothetical protein
MADTDSSATAGVEVRGYRRGTLSTDSWDQYVIPVKDRIVSFTGRAATFVTPGRAAVSQKILALHNATGSSVIVNVNRIRVDLLSTAFKAITVLPPIIRINRFTTLPTNGTALTKTALDSTLTSNASVTAWGDASADNSGAGTSSATTLTITAGAVLAQGYAPRYTGFATPNVTAASGVPMYEMLDTIEFFVGEPDITLRALEGICVFLDQATVTTGNPTTDKWLAVIDWEEYTRP